MGLTDTVSTGVQAKGMAEESYRYRIADIA